MWAWLGQKEKEKYVGEKNRKRKEIRGVIENEEMKGKRGN